MPVPTDNLRYLAKSCFKDRISVLNVAHRVVEFLVRPETSLFVHNIRHFVLPRNSDYFAIRTDQSRAVVEEPRLHLLIYSGKDINSVFLGLARNPVYGWAGDRFGFSEILSIDILGEVNGVEEFRKSDNVGVVFFH